MTFSVLISDRTSGVLAAAAATGSLCVGGWVLRGDIESGLVASQGTAPSTFWRDDVLRRMYRGDPATDAVAGVTGADPGRGHRQMIALDLHGQTGGFTGGDSVSFADHSLRDGLAVAGNMLANEGVLTALRDTAAATPDGLLAALDAAEAAGGDARGLQSAAMLVLSPDHPPLDLRIDHASDPIGALKQLCDTAHRSPYRDWLDEVPVLRDRGRAP